MPTLAKLDFGLLKLEALDSDAIGFASSMKRQQHNSTQVVRNSRRASKVIRQKLGVVRDLDLD